MKNAARNQLRFFFAFLKPEIDKNPLDNTPDLAYIIYDLIIYYVFFIILESISSSARMFEKKDYCFLHHSFDCRPV